MANNVKTANGYGVAGFILSICAVVMTFIRVNTSFVDGWEWIVYGVWCLAAVLSTIGMFRRPRVLAGIGLAICFILVCVTYFVAETVAPL